MQRPDRRTTRMDPNGGKLRFPAGGTNQTRGRDHNLRLVLSLILRHGALSKAEIARATGLSAQAVSLIIQALEKEQLLLRGSPRRGRVGQPSVPIMLNPEGAYAFGMKIGRRSTDMVLLDFTGKVRNSVRRNHVYPDLQETLDFAAQSASRLTAGLASAGRAKIAGLGVAAPYEIWNWTDVLGVKQGRLNDWRNADIAAEVGKRTGLRVYSLNDCTAACSAEHVFGAGSEFNDFMYIFIGTFIGGGVVLDGALYPGPSANAGALGPLPVTHGDGQRAPILELASLYVLENMLVNAGQDASALWLSPDDWDDFGATLDSWIATTAGALAHAVVSMCATVDFPAVVIDGAFPAAVRAALTSKVDKALDAEDMRGLTRPKIVAGRIGSEARAMGAASLPLVSDYLLDRSGPAMTAVSSSAAS